MNERTEDIPPFGWRQIAAGDNQVEIYEYVFPVDGIRQTEPLAVQLIREADRFHRGIDTQVNATDWNVQVRMSVTDGVWDDEKSEFARTVASYAKQV